MAHWWFNPMIHMIFPKRHQFTSSKRLPPVHGAVLQAPSCASQSVFEGKRGRFFSMGHMLEQVWKIRGNLGFNMFPTCFNPSQKFGLWKAKTETPNPPTIWSKGNLHQLSASSSNPSNPRLSTKSKAWR